MNNATTWELVAQFSAIKARVRALNRKNADQPPRYFWQLFKARRHNRWKQLSERHGAIWEIIRTRYSGIFIELINTAARQCNFALSSNLVDETWEYALGDLLNDSALDLQPASFSSSFWVIIADGMDQLLPGCGRGAVAPLKAKFMLRQFVDAMRPGRSKDKLIKHVYDGSPTPLVGGLEAVYDELHGVVREFKADVYEMTGEAITSNAASAERTPYALYDKWLLGI